MSDTAAPTVLYLVPTPIGNLEDITLRAIRVLGEVDTVLAEDTRTSGRLLQHLGLKKPMLSYHLHNEHQTVQRLLERLSKGETMALVSDAGTPGISDPGFLLVRECLAKGLKVECLPGATAFVPALLKSGFGAERFTFEGFLPVKKGRQTRLKELASETRTMIFYESPHRIVKTLEQLAEVLGPERQASVSRELTKLFEETVNGTLPELAANFAGRAAIKGEIVLVVQGREKEERIKEDRYSKDDRSAD
ncbi:16S rRNA (cytidine(1402)-2'-O)-methyltransferase [Hymenobacter taeanensis]|uniref:Ribosomal RNA small subunit methyltransferase I n=1 Tax=Hymenobacter taeanensis TaxID=2735321 RepID=A0A6M6BEV3_9BACT|nr:MULTISPECIES: 16S rRNA (cytidine(1402)-2'-O)-methyltransferase [Hymenobacter]QJX46766.1 16S rRNA (cytidine(1402)-2'-O)-methyltransferase [Hymenobacter taeanensis]UOQ80634.1 16S rRNA (cytidine(1402)-2'-O)-methyltransferase [Hymenobacter sp. 5414T-23]